MVFFLNTAIGLILVVLQTATVPWLPGSDNCYDLLLPYVIYQGIFRPVRENVLLVVGVGVLMDQLSGAPTGLFVVIYLWILVGIRWGIRFFHMGNYFLVPFVVAAAVLLENAFFAVVAVVSSHQASYSVAPGAMVLAQVGWALVSAPLFMVLLNVAHHGWEAWISNLNAERGDVVS